MKLSLLSILTLLLLISSLSNAQVSVTELKKYIVVMDSVETFKNQLTTTMNNLAKGNGKISTGRYNLLMPFANNEAKLNEAKATAEEIAYIKNASAVRDQGTLKFQQVYQSLINDYIGSTVFTKVRNALKSDTILKKKYDSLMVKPVRL